jgi:hypothetical protein
MGSTGRLAKWLSNEMLGWPSGTTFATGVRRWPPDPTAVNPTTNLSSSIGYDARLGRVCDFRCVLKNETMRRRASSDGVALPQVLNRFTGSIPTVTIRGLVRAA